MLPVSARDIQELVGGTLVGGASGNEIVTGKATVDSRTVGEGDLFVAFAGESVDGHDFLGAAAAQGAALALVTRSNVSFPAIQVEDQQQALEALARDQIAKARARESAPKIIALTGSSGKTSTKDLLASILAPVGETIAPVGSRNNELGVPLTLLEVRESTKYMVIEMGARGIGHIDYLTSIVRPDIAIVLNVGSAHVGEFGSVDNIALAKSELVKALDQGGVAVLNADDPRVKSMANATTAHVEYFGLDQAANPAVYATAISLDAAAHPRFTLHLDGEEFDLTLKLTGEHHVSNALAAAVGARAAGLSATQIAEGLASAETRSPGRMQVSEVRDGITVINDAYNANPDSMTVALKALTHLGKQRRTIAVLGEMLELGPESAEVHDAVGRLAVRLNIAQLVVVGSGARAIHNGACLEGSFGDESVYVETLDEAFFVLQKIIEPRDVVLLKSSNGSGLARLGERLVRSWKIGGAEA